MDRRQNILCADTGNQLSDPLTRTPVMVMEARLWEAHLPQGWSKQLMEGNRTN